MNEENQSAAKLPVLSPTETAVLAYLAEHEKALGAKIRDHLKALGCEVKTTTFSLMAKRLQKRELLDSSPSKENQRSGIPPTIFWLREAGRLELFETLKFYERITKKLTS